MTKTITVVWLTLVWMALWESFTLANLLGGVAVAALAMALIPARPSSHRVGFRPLAALQLLMVFLSELAKASVQVAWEIATPGDQTRPAVVTVPLTTGIPGIITTVANMVSLTPGTLTIDVEPTTSTLYVHVLHYQSEAATRAGVLRFEERVLDAFPTRDRHG